MTILLNWFCVCSTLWNMSMTGNIIDLKDGLVSIGPIGIDFNSTYTDDYWGKNVDKIDPKKNVEIATEFLQSLDLPREVVRSDVVPVAAVYYLPAFQRPDPEHPMDPADNQDRMIIVLWPDGQILWSDNLVEGGPPYSMGKVKKEAVDELLRKIKSYGAFNPMLFGRHVFLYCDCSFCRIVATNGSDAMELSSVHELYSDLLDYAFVAEGWYWTATKYYMYNLTKQATEIKRIREKDKAKPQK